MKAIESSVIGILKKYSFEKEVWENYTKDLKIINDLKINSARIVDIILDIEEEFSIEIDDDSIENLISIQNILDIINVKNKLT
jgi:acyl carrier protein